MMKSNIMLSKMLPSSRFISPIAIFYMQTLSSVIHRVHVHPYVVDITTIAARRKTDHVPEFSRGIMIMIGR